MNRYVVVPLLILLFAGTSQAQIKINGPTTAEVKDSVWLDFELLNAEDVKINVIKDGKLIESKEYRLLKDWDGKPTINFNPRSNGMYTFVVAGNMTSKTFLTQHTVKVGEGTPDNNPNPKPDPKPSNELSKAAKAAYDQKPDAEALPALIKVIEEAKRGTNYKTYRDLFTVLDNAASSYLKDGDPPSPSDKLRPLRDVVSQHLTKSLGNRLSVAYDSAKADKALDEILAALKGL